MEKIFAIGDIHGCAGELRQLINKLPLDENCTLVFLGDYIDRGERSKEVVDMVLALQRKFRVVALMGNHEKMLLDFLANAKSPEAASYVFNGGNATLGSYGESSGLYHFPEHHLHFFKNLRLFWETPSYIFVHAGLPDCPIEDLNKEDHSSDFLWIRENFFNSTFKWSKFIIHGHTPKKNPVLTPQRINIDTGCVFGGHLTAIELPSKKFYQVARAAHVAPVYLRDTNSQRQAVRFNISVPVGVRRGKEIFNFMTINYSEFGMLICSPPEVTTVPFKEQEAIKGLIGIPGSQAVVPFEGLVLRWEVKSTGIFYAIKFTKTPAELMQESAVR
ncbi:MAG: metallophosphoesterase [Bacteriovoracaceae bacterium]|nr:metallophosphoesterase [Bacteriovoracaceae bacterium]